jgi:hypothetical protein
VTVNTTVAALSHLDPTLRAGLLAQLAYEAIINEELPAIVRARCAAAREAYLLSI